MKSKADLVQGWLRKAESDLVAMRASAQAGALDAACFHAQQAVEKYLKAYLVERDREIIHRHNLFRLLAACSEIDPTFSQLMDVAELSRWKRATTLSFGRRRRCYLKLKWLRIGSRSWFARWCNQ